MCSFFGFLLLCVGVAVASEEYRAGAIETTNLGNVDDYVTLIREAGKMNVDILVLPSPQVANLSSLDDWREIDNYDETVKKMADASKQAGLYLVAHLLEKAECQNKNELFRSNLVFDRRGNIASVYRKPLNNFANCTSASKDIGSFTTDFGVKFGLMMEEDLILRKVEHMKLKNFIVAGAWHSEIAFLNAAHFTSSWAYANNVNLISSSAIFAGRSGSVFNSETKVRYADLYKFGDEDLELGSRQRPFALPMENIAKLKVSTSEDLSQYVIKPLDVAASVQGYEDTVCHGKFCCKFYVKTGSAGTKNKEVNYGLAAFDGVRHYDRTHNIGVQTCAVIGCAGVSKPICTFGSQINSTNIVFDKIIINGTFSGSLHYPMIFTASPREGAKFFTTVDKNQISIDVSGLENIMTFVIFGRDFSKDTEHFVLNTNPVSIYETINEEVNEMFDYLWIRLRVVLVIASIYVLEMM